MSSLNLNLHPRQFGSRKCEHGDCWTRDGAYAAQCVKLCREHGVWALCDEHAEQVQREHSSCPLPMRFTMQEYVMAHVYPVKP